MRILILTAFTIFALFAKEIPNHSTIFVYHHISDETPKSTSTSPKLFEEHINYLVKNDYKIWPLKDILNYLEKNKTIPKKTVAITFDDAYKSIYTTAYKTLKKYNVPFTVFIHTSAIDSSNLYLTWDELKEMSPLISYGSHSHNHHFFIRETKENIRDDLKKAHHILKEKLNFEPIILAYPFGEVNESLLDIIKEFNYYGVTQESGSINKNFNKFKIPRFPINSSYGTLDRFKSLLNMKPLDIKDVKPNNRVFKEAELKNQSLDFSIEKNNDISLRELNCFDSFGERLEKTIYEDKEEFQVKVKLPFWKMGRQKITCTIPSKTFKDVFYWNSELFFIKSNDNKWYEP